MCKRVHAHLEVCTCSSKSVHMHNWKCALHYPEACTCSNVSMYMPKCKRAHTVNICSIANMHALNCKCAYAQLKTFKSMHILNWMNAHAQLKCAHAQLEVSTWSSVSMNMLNWKRAHTQLKTCICSTKSLYKLNWKCAHAQVEVCASTCFSTEKIGCACLLQKMKSPPNEYVAGVASRNAWDCSSIIP